MLSDAQFSSRRLVAYLSPHTAKCGALFAKPDINGENGVRVYDYDHYRQVITRKTAHRWDYDEAKFKPARVHHWEHRDIKGYPRFEVPAGGGLDDAAPVPRPQL